MGLHNVRLPDVGEGVAEAELVEWHVEVGDRVTTESVLAEVLTDKATVEISSPVNGVIAFLNAQPGDVMAIGSEFVGIEVDGAGNVSASSAARPAAATVSAPASQPAAASPPEPRPEESVVAEEAPPRPREPEVARPRPVADAPARPIAAPVVRQRAKELGVDLRLVRGTGPASRISHADLDAHLAGGSALSPARPRRAWSQQETPLRGVRRKIAQRMSEAWTDIPHITYVEEVDVTGLEELRRALNDRAASGKTRDTRLTLLPFLMLAIVEAVRDQPHLNSTFDSAAQVLTTHASANIGIATQTSDGLVVPVVRDAQSLDVWELAAEVSRVSEAARAGSAKREELSGSTITITSLGKLGGLVTTPIINHPEVAIIGVNKIQVRPVWDERERGGAFVPRTMMNLSASFDHRIIDGWDAATFVQRIKELLELPALLFIDG